MADVTDIITLTQLKQELHVAAADTAKDADFTELLHDAADLFRTECPSFVFEADTAFEDELYDGNGSRVLQTRHWPIVSVEELLIEDEEIDADDFRVYERYIKFPDQGVYSARLRTVSGCFPEGSQNISLSYTVGVEVDSLGYRRAQKAVKAIADFLWQRQGKRGISSVGVPVEGTQTVYASTPIMGGDLPHDIQLMLRYFQPPRVAIA